MKSTRPRQATLLPTSMSPPEIAAVAATPRGFVDLTAETVTDAMIRAMLADVRHSGDTHLAVVCAKALRHAATITTNAQATARLAARIACAREINERAADWLSTGCPDDRLYASLVGVAPLREPAAEAAATAPDIPLHPLCWECNLSIETDEEHRIVNLRAGKVSVHLECINAIDVAELASDPGEAVIEAAGIEPEGPRCDESMFGGRFSELDAGEAFYDPKDYRR
jgi:hypothetical protein